MKVIDKKLFTLIELLVVVAIIGILVSMLMPALSKAREKVRRVVCLSNQNQVMIGIYSFSGDNDDVGPSAQVELDSPGHGNLAAWSYAFGNYPEFGKWRGIGILFAKDYLNWSAAAVVTCPTNLMYAPHLNLDVIDHRAYGGMVTDGDTTGNVYIIPSMSYRGSFDFPAPRPPKFNKDNSEEAILSDHFSLGMDKVYGASVVMGHQDGYNVSYLDGSANYVYDKSYTVAMQSGGNFFNANYNTIESVYLNYLNRK